MFVMIDRSISDLIEKDFSKGKILLLMGPRQVGKTTLFEHLAEKSSEVLKLNCDNYDIRTLLEEKTSTELKELIGNNKIVFIDEAQKVHNIGQALKMMADIKADVNILVTGSSSLDLANEINEPATGRIWEYRLFPMSIQELNNHTSKLEESRLLKQRLIMGMYPEVVTKPSEAKKILINLTNNYLYKDILEYKGLRKPALLQNLVRALALQIGSEVSYNELATMLGANKETIETYIDLLEKCFVIFKISSYSRNLRNEIKKGKKIYFYDNGVRNAVINNFAPIELRKDVGQLWENFIIAEKIKRNAYTDNYVNMFFWRTHEQQEIDLIEEQDGILHAYEFKWNPKRESRLPKIFVETYPDYTFAQIDNTNYLDFISY